MNDQNHDNSNFNNTKIGAVREIANITGLSQKEVRLVLSAYQRYLLTVLKSENEVRLLEIGKIKIADTPERQAINPKTKEKILILAKKSPKFAFAKKVKEFVNGLEELPPFGF